MENDLRDHTLEIMPELALEPSKKEILVSSRQEIVQKDSAGSLNSSGNSGTYNCSGSGSGGTSAIGLQNILGWL